ncbi:DUF559 domain-containing protein [Candidatus Peregrinibacteria bacterium]|nr:DUF559 domain-containing protein [Candidatus Peregrinibacteria bacterium]
MKRDVLSRRIRRSLSHARALRQRTTDPEKILWRRLRNRRFHGVKFRRQMAIGNFIVDFCSPEHHLVIELDGIGHLMKKRRDEARDYLLIRSGYTILRFSNQNIRHALHCVLQKIADACGITLQIPDSDRIGFPPLPREGEGRGEGAIPISQCTH